MPIRAGRLTRLVPIFAVLAFATIPATAANAALVFSPATTLSFGETTAGMQTSDQTLGPSTCPPMLGPSGTRSVNVRFNPPSTGSFNAQVQVNNDAPGSPAQRSLNGTGVAANLSLSPNSTDSVSSLSTRVTRRGRSWFRTPAQRQSRSTRSR